MSNALICLILSLLYLIQTCQAFVIVPKVSCRHHLSGGKSKIFATSSSTSPPKLSFWEQLVDSLSPKSLKKTNASTITMFDEDILNARNLLVSAANSKSEDGNTVVEALMSLEKLMRSKNKLDENKTSRETLKNLNGSWRLIFTTGTVDSQKKFEGRINYFPINAVQSFDTSSMTLTNGIYVGNFALLKFFGPFQWIEKARKLEFDFDDIAVLGVKFSLPKGGAAKIGQSTGLGSENNVELVKQDRKPFFNWISADADIATARGGGGGLALWKRDPEMEEIDRIELSRI